jgi:hypothetical protein
VRRRGWRAGEPHAALAQANGVLAGLDARSDVEASAWPMVIGRCRQALAQHIAARAAFERAEHTAVRLGGPLLAATASGALATQDRVEGRYLDAANRGRAAQAAAQAGDTRVIVASLRNDPAITCKHLARYDDAETGTWMPRTPHWPRSTPPAMRPTSPRSRCTGARAG